MKVELYHTSTELKQLFRKKKNAILATRICAVYLALMGKSAPEIAALLGYRRRTIQNGVYAYNRQGLEGLLDTLGRGQQGKLNADQLRWLRQRLEEGPPPKSGLSVFHGKDIQHLIEQQFRVTYHLHSIYKLLHRPGDSYISSRPEHPKGDPQARETFKKKSLIRSGNSVLISLE